MDSSGERTGLARLVNARNSSSSSSRVARHQAGVLEHAIRIERLQAHQRAAGWSDSELARQLGKSPSQIHAWATGQRNIGERLARQIEELLELPISFLDERVMPPGDLARTNASGLTPEHLVPVLDWPSLGALLTVTNCEIGAACVHLGTASQATETAKFVEMNDTSMAPDVGPGDHLLIDPAVAPRAGDLVLVRLPSGEHLVRKHVVKTGTASRFEALNADYATLTSTDDRAVAVGTVIEQRRYRGR